MSRTTFARAGFLLAALALAGCNESLDDIAPRAAGKQLPAEVVRTMQAKGMTTTSPIMLRIFKEESTLEVWKQKPNGRYDMVIAYGICKWSGKLGPKYTEGDRQAPEGFYNVGPGQMNPNSSYHLSFNIGYPNAYDAINGRSGKHLMVHGACSSSGCYSMTDDQIEQIYAFARDAFRGGQTSFQIQAFPFRMTAANMARYKDDPNYEFWKMLKVGYDNFEITKVPPKVDICEKKYVFNQMAEGEDAFKPGAACPSSTQPDALKVAYKSYQSSYDTAFNAALGGFTKVAPKPSILGTKEAQLVAEWTRKRARGERVPIEPPSLQSDGSVTVTERMGRIDSPAGRRMAALEAAAEEKRLAAEAKKRAADEKAAAIAFAKAQKEKAAAQPAAVASAAPAQQPVQTATSMATAQAAAPTAAEGTVARMRKRLLGMFGS